MIAVVAVVRAATAPVVIAGQVPVMAPVQARPVAAATRWPIPLKVATSPLKQRAPRLPRHP